MFRTAFLANYRLNARKYTTSKGNGVALVTGGTGGLGREFARKALSWGSTHVVLIDVIESPNLTEFDSSKVSYIRCDVSQVEDLRQAFQAAADRVCFGE
jgi:NAD(P)-dependent dehydrogenase (short-subunit alcohol dehydrogenase family)